MLILPHGRQPADAVPPPVGVEATEQALAVQAMLNEYNSLRQESMSSIGHRVTVANFSFGAVAVIVAAFITQQKPDWVMGLVTMLLVPQIAKVGLLIWLGEYNRSQRAGKWIAELEQRVSATVSCNRVMAWESTLLGNSIHMTYPYLSVVLLLLGVGWTSTIVGAAALARYFGAALLQPWAIVVVVVLVAVVVTVEVLFIRFFRAKWREIKRNYSRNGPTMWII